MRRSVFSRRSAVAFAVSTAMLLVGCESDSLTESRTRTSIEVTPATQSLAVGATQQLTVTAIYSDATTAALVVGLLYSSSAAGVATVSATGLVTAVAAGTATITVNASGQTDDVAITVNSVAPPSTSAVVFSDNYDGVSFANFGGATNNVTLDATTLYSGRKSVKAVIGSVNYSGGAFVSSGPRNLSAFNAVTFYAKGSVANATLKVGVGNNAATTVLNAESIGIALTTGWVKYIVPLPNSAKAINFNGLFHFADGPNNYTVWFADIQYESLPVGQVAAPSAALVAWPTVTVAVGTPYTMNPAPNTVNWTTPALPNGGKLTDVAWRWYTLTSSNPAVATVSIDGVINGLTAGTTTITATLGGLPVPSSSTITVSAPLAVPSTIAPTPALAVGNVISLFTTAYPNRVVESWQTGWSAANSSLTDPFATGARNVRRYSLFNFVGIEFGIVTPANAIDGTTMTHVHFDVWSPNPSSTLEIQVVNDASGASAIGRYPAGTLATGTWVSLDLPLASFVGLTAKNKLQQILFVANNPMVIYVDNIYFHK